MGETSSFELVRLLLRKSSAQPCLNGLHPAGFVKRNGKLADWLRGFRPYRGARPGNVVCLARFAQITTTLGQAARCVIHIPRQIGLRSRLAPR
jgi:hypothetical protein